MVENGREWEPELKSWSWIMGADFISTIIQGIMVIHTGTKTMLKSLRAAFEGREPKSAKCMSMSRYCIIEIHTEKIFHYRTTALQIRRIQIPINLEIISKM